MGPNPLLFKLSVGASLFLTFIKRDVKFIKDHSDFTHCVTRKFYIYFNQKCGKMINKIL